MLNQIRVIFITMSIACAFSPSAFAFKGSGLAAESHFYYSQVIPLFCSVGSVGHEVHKFSIHVMPNHPEALLDLSDLHVALVEEGDTLVLMYGATPDRLSSREAGSSNLVTGTFDTKVDGKISVTCSTGDL